MARDIDIERFEQFFTRGAASECWEWQGGTLGNGYGSFKVSTDDGPKTCGAHRVMAKLELDAGLDLWPGKHSGFQVLHECDNPACVNSNHLYIGDTSDNMQDAFDRGKDSPFAECSCNDGTIADCSIHGNRNGAKNPNAALSDAEAVEIRDRYDAEDVSYADLAGDYDCSVDTIGRVVRGERYA